jgi:hypothetical protein
LLLVAVQPGKEAEEEAAFDAVSALLVVAVV